MDVGEGQRRVERENREPEPWLLVGRENIRSAAMSEVRFSWKQSPRQKSHAHDFLKKCSKEKPKRSRGNWTVKGKTSKRITSGEVPISPRSCGELWRIN